MKTLREYIEEAEQKKVAIGHFNISNMEAFHGIVNAAKKLNLPVIIGTSEGERNYTGVHEVVALVKTMREKYDLPVFLNADHTYTYEGVVEAVDAGFDAVIFDGAKLSFEENIEVTKKCVDYASSKGVLVEAELGNIGQSSKMIDEMPEGIATSEFMTKVEEAKEFVEKTGVNLLAPAVGNMHGMLKGKANPKIDTKRIEEIGSATGVPLVLHGGSGISDEDFVASIKAGISTVHINTEIRVAMRDAIKLSLQENPDEIAPYKYLKPAAEAVEKVVSRRLRLFNGSE